MTNIDPSLLAWVYDQTMEDRPNELDFYFEPARNMPADGKILDIGCGTGRVAIHLGKQGYTVTGFDISAKMLARALQKSAEFPKLNWVQGDMRSFNLNDKFNLAFIPGHSFQFMLTSQAQFDCLTCIKACMHTGARLVIYINHEDIAWLAGLPHEPGTLFEPAGEIAMPEGNHKLRISRAWSYEHSTQNSNLRESPRRIECRGPNNKNLAQ